MPSLNLSGKFYPTFTSNANRYLDADKACIQRTVEQLLRFNTSASRPGMLLGKVMISNNKISCKINTFKALWVFL